MKKTAAIIVSLCLSAGICGCTNNANSSSSDFNAPSYLKKYQNDEQESNESEQSDNLYETEEPQEETPKAAPASAQPQENNEATVQHPEEETAQTTEYAPATTSDGFRYGIWWANDGSGDSYYFFAPDNRTGSLFTQENGLELGFSYEIYGNTAVFHMDGVDGSLQAMVEWIDSSELILHWTDGHAESLVYYSAVEPSGFCYYNNSQLIALALDHFELQNGWRPSYAEADIGAGGLIEVFMYDGELCCECYSVDRFTAAGTDLSGNSVELDQ